MNRVGTYIRPQALEKKDEPVASSIYYRPFLYGTPSRWGMMGRGMGMGVAERKGWVARWLKNIFKKN